MVTPLQPINRDQVAEFWSRFLKTGMIDSSTSVPDAVEPAWDEGEGDRTRQWWLDAHERFFRRHLSTIGVDFDPGMTTVFERFDVLFAE